MGVIGQKRVVRKDEVRDGIFFAPPPLTGGIFFFGRIGAGKTTAMFTLSQKYHDHPERRYKIIDLWGGERNEHLYWTLPNRDYKYWDIIRKKFRLENTGPKQYTVNLLYPMTRNLPEKLPHNPPFVKSKIFTIPTSSITIEDAAAVIGIVSNENRYLWNEAFERLKDKDNGAMLEYIMKDLGGSKKHIYKSFILPLVRDRVLQPKNFDLNVDFLSEFKDKETITVLCLDFVEKPLKLFYMSYMLRHLSESIDAGKARGHYVIMMREASEFFRATDNAIIGDEYKVFRSYLAHWIRYGRKGLHLLLDAQSSAETRGILDGNQDLTILGKLPAQADREQSTLQLYKDNMITKKQIADLATLNKGEYFIHEVSKKVKRRYFFLPRTMYWKPEYGNFYANIWKKLVDKWTNTESATEMVNASYESTATTIQDLELLARLNDEKAKAKKTTKKKEKIDEDELDKDDIDSPEEELAITKNIQQTPTHRTIMHDESKKEVPPVEEEPHPSSTPEGPVSSPVQVVSETPKLNTKPKIKWNPLMLKKKLVN